MLATIPKSIVTREGVLMILVRPDAEPGGQSAQTDDNKRASAPSGSTMSYCGLGFVKQRRRAEDARRGSALSRPTLWQDRLFERSIPKKLSAVSVALWRYQPESEFLFVPSQFQRRVARACVPLEIARMLGGWARFTSTDEMYGAGFTAGTLAAELNKVSYGPSSDPSHLYRL